LDGVRGKTVREGRVACGLTAIEHKYDGGASTLAEQCTAISGPVVGQSVGFRPVSRSFIQRAA